MTTDEIGKNELIYSSEKDGEPNIIKINKVLDIGGPENKIKRNKNGYEIER